ncbi:hypothetical protein EBESD8_50090 [Rhodococcus aetherivorans]|nr:hypothetical protein EBESD8_50090 [Rhodococcus aetherivorans]
MIPNSPATIAAEGDIRRWPPPVTNAASPEAARCSRPTTATTNDCHDPTTAEYP